jgi:hypothetical protein
MIETKINICDAKSSKFLLFIYIFGVFFIMFFTLLNGSTISTSNALTLITNNTILLLSDDLYNSNMTSASSACVQSNGSCSFFSHSMNEDFLFGINPIDTGLAVFTRSVLLSV